MDIGDPAYELAETKTDRQSEDSEAALKKLRENWAEYDLTIYTDGSTLSSNENGGAGIIFTTSPPEDPRILRTVSIPAGRWCSSHRAELKAVAFALEDEARDKNLRTIRVVQDSKAVLTRIENCNPTIPLASSEEKTILESLQKCHRNNCKVTFSWCQSHCGVKGNELADDAAKVETKENQNNVGILDTTAKAAIWRFTRREFVTKPLLRAIYGERGEQLNRVEERRLSRKDQVTVSRLRSGHHPDLRYWQNLINSEESTQCRGCEMGQETAEHVLLECPAVGPFTRGTLVTKGSMAKDHVSIIRVWNRWRTKVIGAGKVASQ
ncbi:uncharacterized protein LOC144207684 [Stigmatopora nigra]